MTEKAPITQVVVALIFDKNKKLLVSYRSKNQHQGDLWEFPGGKIEPGESTLQALKREILEELNIRVLDASSFKKVHYVYADKAICLNVWRVHEYSGQAVGNEAQLIKWLDIDELTVDDFPKANNSIIRALKLPDKYMITGEYKNHDDYINRLKSSLNKGIRLLQLRSKNISDEQFIKLADVTYKFCKKNKSKLLLNTSPENFAHCEAHGLHLSSYYLHSIKRRPIARSLLLSVACHTEKDIEQAKQLEADIVLISPVKKTTSHPAVQAISWQGFSQLSTHLNIPAYALGGMQEQDLSEAKAAGAQGIAAISSFWNLTE